MRVDAHSLHARRTTCELVKRDVASNLATRMKVGKDVGSTQLEEIGQTLAWHFYAVASYGRSRDST